MSTPTLVNAYETIRSHAEQTNLPRSEHAALALLTYAQDSTMNALARHCGLSKAACTALVDRLENAGMVKRFHKHGDRRLVYVSATRKGQRAMEVCDA